MAEKTLGKFGTNVPYLSFGYIVSGHMVIQDSNGHEQQVGPGEAFEVSPGHDAWVMGSVPCIALDFTHIPNE